MAAEDALRPLLTTNLRSFTLILSVVFTDESLRFQRPRGLLAALRGAMARDRVFGGVVAPARSSTSGYSLASLRDGWSVEMIRPAPA